MLSSKQKKYLRGEAQKIKSRIQLGKQNLSQELLQTIEAALQAHELVKIHLLNNANSTKNVALEQLQMELNLDYAYAIGNQLVLYKKSDKKEKQILSQKVESLNKI